MAILNWDFTTKKQKGSKKRTVTHVEGPGLAESRLKHKEHHDEMLLHVSKTNEKCKQEKLNKVNLEANV